MVYVTFECIDKLSVGFVVLQLQESLVAQVNTGLFRVVIIFCHLRNAALYTSGP